MSSGVIGQPMTYQVDGKQYVAVQSGWGGVSPLWGGPKMNPIFRNITLGGNLRLRTSFLEVNFRSRDQHRKGDAAKRRPSSFVRYVLHHEFAHQVRSLAAASVMAALMICAATARAPSGVATVSHAAPAFDLETPSGDNVTLRTFAGRPLVMNVFASWCPPCREELPRIVSAAHSAKSRVAFLGVDEQEAEQMATMFAKQMHLPYPIALDHGQFAASYGARSLPETIFVDAHGTVRAIVHGTISAELLAKHLAEISR